VRFKRSGSEGKVLTISCFLFEWYLIIILFGFGAYIGINAIVLGARLSAIIGAESDGIIMIIIGVVTFLSCIMIGLIKTEIVVDQRARLLTTRTKSCVFKFIKPRVAKFDDIIQVDAMLGFGRDEFYGLMILLRSHDSIRIRLDVYEKLNTLASYIKVECK
jgi:hypothetical protein